MDANKLMPENGCQKNDLKQVVGVMAFRVMAFLGKDVISRVWKCQKCQKCQEF